MNVIVVILAAVAAILAGIEIINGRGRGLVAWSALAAAIALLVIGFDVHV
jgi:hypothetical protein